MNFTFGPLFKLFLAASIALHCSLSVAADVGKIEGDPVDKDKAVVNVYANEDFTMFSFYTGKPGYAGGYSYSKSHIMDILLWAIKDKSLIYVSSPMSDLFDGEPNADAFRILFLKDLLDIGFERVIFETSRFTYDSAKDPLVAFWELNYGKRLRNAAKPGNDSAETEEDEEDVDFGEEYSFYVPGKADAYYAKYRQDSWKMGREEDPLEEKGYVSLEHLKELGENGDDDAYLFYAKYLAGLEFYNGDLNIAEAVRVLEMLADRGNYHAAASLFYIYSVGGVADINEGSWSYFGKNFIEFYDEDKALKYRDIIFKNYVEFFPDKFGFYVGTWIIDEAEKDKNFEFLKFCIEHFDGCGQCEFIKSSFSTEKVFKNVTCEVCRPISVLYGIEKLGEFIEVENPDFAYKCLKRLQENQEIIYDGSFGDPFWEDVFLVAHFYIYGIGAERNPEKAAEMVEKCFFAPRLVESMLSAAYLAYAYENGLGVERSERKAYYYWKRFYTNERADIYGSAAARFYNGFGFPQDKKLAAEILEKSLERISDGKDEILGALVKIYGGEFDESEKDYEKLYLYKEMQRALDMARVLDDSEG